MGLIEKETGNYYKINFDRCKIQGLQVFVNYSVYESEAHRLKEKEREVKWAEFFQKLREDLDARNGELLTQIEAAGLEPTEILNADEGLIDRAKYPRLRELQDDCTQLQDLERTIGERLFRIGEVPPLCLEFSDETSKRLKALGFDKSWLTEPVRIIAGGEVNTGEYKGEPINQELFYNRLKSVLGDSINAMEEKTQ